MIGVATEYDQEVQHPGSLAHRSLVAGGNSLGTLLVLQTSGGICMVAHLPFSPLDRTALSRLRNASGNALSFEWATGHCLSLSAALDVVNADSPPADR